MVEWGKYWVRHLEKVQRWALRLICVAFKTSIMNALEIEASIPFIKHQVMLIFNAGTFLGKYLKCCTGNLRHQKRVCKH